MNENLLKRIKRQLNAKFYVMNDAWLRDCVEFFIRDKVPHEMTDRHIFEFAEGQWQLSDLREICSESGCLPRNLIQQAHTALTGTYVLQVDKMYDIASSKFKQLCEIRRVISDNLEVAVDERPAERPPKARRMMQLCLTDGVQDITAIEYTPLKQMTGTLLPGYKVMIIGPVNCRRGVILLEDGKYKEVGGEVEGMLKPNAPENVFARALGEPENPDPYNDNGIANAQGAAPNPNDSFFDDDFEEAIDLEAVTAIERRSQEAVAVQESSASTPRGQMDGKRTNEVVEETLEDIDFEPLDDWFSDAPARPSRAVPMGIKKSDERDDMMIVEEASTSAHDSRSKPPPLPASVIENLSDFPDDDFDFDDCDIIIKTEKSRSQSDGNSLRIKNEACSSPLRPTSKLANRNVPMEVEKCISAKATHQSEKSAASTSRGGRQVPQARTIPSFFAPRPAPKICDTLSDVLREPIVGEKIYRTVSGRVRNHSTLTKQGKCWSVTALIEDRTSSVEVCFDSEILERFLGFTVQEFSRQKRLAKLDPQVKSELRLTLRKAQHEIKSLDGLLKLELAQGRMPKIVSIAQLTARQREDLAKGPA